MHLRGRSRASGYERVLLRCCAAAAALAALAVLASCATLPGGRGWGEDVTLAPGWKRVGDAALGAVETPRFWGPLAAAAVFQIDGWDQRASGWARRNTPIFGSQHRAYDWSYRLRAASAYAYFASVLAAPSGKRRGTWVLDKIRGLAVGYAAVGATDEESALLRDAAARERPNGAATGSMPSSHTSRSAVLTELAEQNLQAIDMSRTTRRILDFGLDGLTYATAWARVEAGYHYPSDTLVGMAIGNFNGAFFNDAFMGLAMTASSPPVSLVVLPGGAALRWRLEWR